MREEIGSAEDECWRSILLNADLLLNDGGVRRGVPAESRAAPPKTPAERRSCFLPAEGCGIRLDSGPKVSGSEIGDDSADLHL